MTQRSSLGLLSTAREESRSFWKYEHWDTPEEVELFSGGRASIGKGPHHCKFSAVAVNKCTVPSHDNRLPDSVSFDILAKLWNRETSIIVIEH